MLHIENRHSGTVGAVNEGMNVLKKHFDIKDQRGFPEETLLYIDDQQGESIVVQCLNWIGLGGGQLMTSIFDCGILVFNKSAFPVSLWIVSTQVDSKIDRCLESHQHRNPSGDDFRAVLRRNAGVGQGQVGPTLTIILQGERGGCIPVVLDCVMRVRNCPQHTPFPFDPAREDKVNRALTFIGRLGPECRTPGIR